MITCLNSYDFHTVSSDVVNILFPVKYFPLLLSNLTNNLVSNLHSSKDHNFMFFSLDGHMLCAQGGAPDYSLSLWDWRAGVVVARATSPFTLTVHFSSFSQNNIVSCGKSVVNGNNHKSSCLTLKTCDYALKN